MFPSFSPLIATRSAQAQAPGNVFHLVSDTPYVLLLVPSPSQTSTPLTEIDASKCSLAYTVGRAASGNEQGAYRGLLSAAETRRPINADLSGENALDVFDRGLLSVATQEGPSNAAPTDKQQAHNETLSSLPALWQGGLFVLGPFVFSGTGTLELVVTVSSEASRLTRSYPARITKVRVQLHSFVCAPALHAPEGAQWEPLSHR
jgi:hypothetical protein